MKKKLIVSVVTAIALVGAALPAFAAVDPDVTTNAYIDYSQGSTTYVRGKSYARTTNTKMTKLNVQGVFSTSSGSQLESAVVSTTTKGEEAAWYTKDKTYSAKGSYKLNTTSRTYYSGGSYDQDYASTSW
ncbi:hypothetical protein DNH61_24610 [Paenibacillus sambharensis]|uniref:Surface layer protein A domain-containing protein n=1 Tax=Paenibacillus sambharensis TaxID=1803190 RepID=A0A2W1L4V9_9BACL|nr:hypothetical protein [Paenibacillus sambharensis]PZD93230.1 hypothetical protein DNH61_24610 [Paenibacillus sambharensis]